MYYMLYVLGDQGFILDKQQLRIINIFLVKPVVIFSIEIWGWCLWYPFKQIKIGYVLDD